jgi:hypothetical protein
MKKKLSNNEDNNMEINLQYFIITTVFRTMINEHERARLSSIVCAIVGKMKWQISLIYVRGLFSAAVPSIRQRDQTTAKRGFVCTFAMLLIF